MEEIFDAEEFKQLPWRKRFIIRIKVAFFETIKMF